MNPSQWRLHKGLRGLSRKIMAQLNVDAPSSSVDAL
jgi:hypothetical protein